MTFKAFLCSGLLVGAIKYYEQERMVDEPNRTDPVQSQIDDLIQNLPWVGVNTHCFTIIVQKIFQQNYGTYGCTLRLSNNVQSQTETGQSSYICTAQNIV